MMQKLKKTGQYSVGLYDDRQPVRRRTNLGER